MHLFTQSIFNQEKADGHQSRTNEYDTNSRPPPKYYQIPPPAAILAVDVYFPLTLEEKTREEKRESLKCHIRERQGDRR